MHYRDPASPRLQLSTNTSYPNIFEYARLLKLQVVDSFYPLENLLHFLHMCRLLLLGENVILNTLKR